MWLMCLLLVLPLAGTAANAKKKKAAPAKKTAPAVRAAEKTTPAPTLSAAPPLGAAPSHVELKARLAWAQKEAEGLRAIVAKNPQDAAARTLLASLAVVATRDLERALSVGDIESATGLRELVKGKLFDTRWRLGNMGRQGDGAGFFSLAVMSLHGILDPRDPETACQLFTSAWDKGELEAAYRLSACTADHANSAALLQSAADAGHAAAREDLGRRCLEAQPRDVACAAKQIAAAAAAGRPSAKSLLGWMSAQGVGMTADPARAQALYLEAAQAGDLSALNNLGELYESGRGVPADPVQAVARYREAAVAGFAPAQFNLGRMYAGGTGVTRDFGEARRWLDTALKAGIQPAKQLLDWLDTQSRTAGSSPGGSGLRRE